mmetsp:Transcript_61968/g.147639  ORF Transcript_61968/g.147639 Transcript_61968/m.147639 type:complete len:231 (-) Transcript_61968:27-719(-)
MRFHLHQGGACRDGNRGAPTPRLQRPSHRAGVVHRGVLQVPRGRQRPRLRAGLRARVVPRRPLPRAERVSRGRRGPRGRRRGRLRVLHAPHQRHPAEARVLPLPRPRAQGPRARLPHADPPRPGLRERLRRARGGPRPAARHLRALFGRPRAHPASVRGAARARRGALRVRHGERREVLVVREPRVCRAPRDNPGGGRGCHVSGAGLVLPLAPPRRWAVGGGVWERCLRM